MELSKVFVDSNSSPMVGRLSINLLMLMRMVMLIVKMTIMMMFINAVGYGDGDQEFRNPLRQLQI